MINAFIATVIIGLGLLAISIELAKITSYTSMILSIICELIGFIMIFLPVFKFFI